MKKIKKRKELGDEFWGESLSMSAFEIWKKYEELLTPTSIKLGDKDEFITATGMDIKKRIRPIKRLTNILNQL